jgi:homopolymeric O-antigen transport system permease protein
MQALLGRVARRASASNGPGARAIGFAALCSRLEMSAEPSVGEPAARLDPSLLTPEQALGGPALRTVVVRPERRWRLPDFQELWRYRELFWVLALRDIRVRYKQTTLGVAWAVIQPLFTMIVFTMISRFGRFSTDGIRPEVFYYCGMLPWLLFSNSLTSAGNSLVGNQDLIAKTYFPRLIVPVASVITALIDFAIAFVVLLLLLLVYGVAPAPQVVLLPLFVAGALLTAVGFGIWLSALNVRFRDLRHASPFVVQLWFFSTPVLYSSSAVRGWKAVVLALNPLSGVVEGLRWCVLGRPAPGPMFFLSMVTVPLVLVTSLFFFHRTERTMADLL